MKSEEEITAEFMRLEELLKYASGAHASEILGAEVALLWMVKDDAKPLSEEMYERGFSRQEGQ